MDGGRRCRITCYPGHCAADAHHRETEQSLVAAEGPTKLQQKLDRGEFIVSVEIDPPKGLNPTKALEGARLLQAAGVDFINVADSPMARVRMSALTLVI